MPSIILEKEKCINTINTWKEVRYDLRKIRELIRTFFGFQCEDQDSKGIKIDDVSVNFHTSIGIHSWIPLLMCAPLTLDGFTYSNYFKSTNYPAHVGKDMVIIIKKLITFFNLTIVSCHEQSIKALKEPSSNAYSIVDIPNNDFTKPVLKFNSTYSSGIQDSDIIISVSVPSRDYPLPHPSFCKDIEYFELFN